MRELEITIMKRAERLKEIIRKAEQQKFNSPNGKIHICKKGNRVQYYYKDCSIESKRKYMKNSEIEFVKSVCQKDYNNQILPIARKELKLLEQVLNVYKKSIVEDIYPNLHPHRRSLITPIYLPDDEYIKQWEEQENGAVSFKEDTLIFTTDKGERVRSKSEVLIANALNRNNIPYKYEQPLNLKGGVTIHPDFTILNVRKRKTIYYEHFGMMDDSQYVEKNFLKKMEIYEKNGIFPGEQLIFTFESGKMPINQNTIKQLIEKYLK